MTPTSAGACPAPPSAAAVFGDRYDLAAAYVHILATHGINRGMIGPHEAGRLWERHLFNSVAPQSLIPPAARVVDLGSGAGLPGIPLALARPDVDMVLLEPMARRVAFLQFCIAELGLSRVSVVRGRAEHGLRPPADIVVARAVARFDRLIPWARAVCRNPLRLLAIKGESVDADMDVVRGCRPAVQLTRHDLAVEGVATVVIEATSDVRPRSGGVA